MKYYFSLLLLIITFSESFSQEKNDFIGFSQSDFYLSGQINYAKTTSENFSQSAFNFQPTVGYFLDNSNALELGLIVGLNEAGDSETNSFGVQTSLIHFFNTENKFSFTLGVGLAYVSTKFDNGFQGDYTSNLFQGAVFPGVNYFVSDNFSLIANLGVLSYVTEKGDFQGAEDVNSFNINLNLSNINFGVLYKF